MQFKVKQKKEYLISSQNRHTAYSCKEYCDYAQPGSVLMLIKNVDLLTKVSYTTLYLGLSCYFPIPEFSFPVLVIYPFEIVT